MANRLIRLYIDYSIAVALEALTLLPLGGRAAGIVIATTAPGDVGTLLDSAPEWSVFLAP